MNTNEQEEYRLAVQAREGDTQALNILVERLRVRLFAIAYAELRHYEDAQDAVASALLRICLHIGDLQDTTRLRAWMHAVVRNEARRLFQQRTRTATQGRLQELSDLLATPQPSHLRLDVERALRSLPADQARALALFYLANLPIREIARRTGRPEGTIKSWLHHGRQQLAQTMKEYAPMTPTEWTAAIVSTELEPAVLNALSDALRAAGFRRVHLFDDYRKVVTTGDFRILESGLGETKEFHLPAPLQGTHLLILDERIGGLSAFELHLILRAAAREDNTLMAHCILLDPPDPTDEQASRIRVFASWVAGFDLCFNKPVKPAEFQTLATRLREGLQAQLPA